MGLRARRASTRPWRPFPGADGARRARPGAGARARCARAEPSSPGRAWDARPRPARSSTPWCAASRRRSCWTRTRSTRSPSGWRRCAERPGPTALTPHAGELARLLGRDSEAIADARLASVGEAAERSGAAVLLKGPDTLIAAPGEPLRVVETAVPQLATAGAGDVLAGAVGALVRARPPAGPGARARRRGARLGRAPGALRPGLADRRRPAAPARAAARVTRSTLEVDLGAVRANVRHLIRVAAGSEVWAVVKADGYGHGAIECAGAALTAGAARLCCATLGEAHELREALGPDVPLVVMSPLEPGEEAGGGRLRDRGLLARGLRAAARLGRRLRRPRQGRHGHGALGHGSGRCARRRSRAGGEHPTAATRWPDVAPRDRGQRSRLRRGADRGLRRSRAEIPALPQAPGQLGRGARAARDALRRRALRHRDLRRLALRGRAGGARPAARAALDEPRRRPARARARPVRGLRPAPDRRPPAARRPRAGRLRRRLPAARERALRGAGARRATARSPRRSRWISSRASSTSACSSATRSC